MTPATSTRNGKNQRKKYTASGDPRAGTEPRLARGSAAWHSLPCCSPDDDFANNLNGFVTDGVDRE